MTKNRLIVQYCNNVTETLNIVSWIYQSVHCHTCKWLTQFRFVILFDATGPILSVKELEKYLDAEYAIFERNIEHILGLMVKKHKGYPFAQVMHDGGTPKNKKKYQAIGLQFIDPEWRYSIYDVNM